MKNGDDETKAYTLPSPIEIDGVQTTGFRVCLHHCFFSVNHNKLNISILYAKFALDRK